MLAQSFKTAPELGLTDREFESLVKTLVLLETGKLRHVPPIETIEMSFECGDQKKLFSGEFNMANWSKEHKCGTVACIGGTAELVGNLHPYELYHKASCNSDLHSLFYPPIVDCSRNPVTTLLSPGEVGAFSEVTTDHAAMALRNYLTTGKANWLDILYTA